MNYAQISVRPFSTRKNIVMKKTVTDEMKKRQSYFAAHTFSISVNPSTKEAVLKVMPKDG